MGRVSCTFKEADLTRAFKAAKKAGVDVQVEIDLDRKRMRIIPVKVGAGHGDLTEITTDEGEWDSIQ